jgi:hypothetical protein
VPDVFVSYSSADEKLATFVHKEVIRHGIDCFAACADLKPGDHWSPAILANLRESNYVVVLASKAASSSAFVNQEIGAALIASKNLVPVVWDMDPAHLPGWLGRVQAIDLRGKTLETLQTEIGVLASRIRQGRDKAVLVIGALVLGFLMFGAGE